MQNLIRPRIHYLLSHKATALPSSSLHADTSCRVPPPHEALQGIDSLQGDQVYGHDCVLHGSLRVCVPTNAAI